MFNKRIGAKGFTMLEMVVSIVVLSIIMFLAIPKFTGLVAQAKKVKMVADVRAVQTALNIDTIRNGLEIPGIESTIDGNILADMILENNNSFIDKGQIVFADNKTEIKENTLEYPLDENEIRNTNFHKLSDEYLELAVNATLEGDFLVNNDGLVVYVGNEDSKITEEGLFAKVLGLVTEDEYEELEPEVEKLEKLLEELPEDYDYDLLELKQSGLIKVLESDEDMTNIYEEVVGFFN